MTTNTTNEVKPSHRILGIILELWPHIAERGVDETDKNGIWARVLDGLTPEQTERGIDWLLMQTKPVTFPAPIREAALVGSEGEPGKEGGEDVAAWTERIANLACFLGVDLSSNTFEMVKRCVDADEKYRAWVKRRAPGEPERELPWRDAAGLAEAVAKNLDRRAS